MIVVIFLFGIFVGLAIVCMMQERDINRIETGKDKKLY